jgi:hypothetical protein
MKVLNDDGATIQEQKDFDQMSLSMSTLEFTAFRKCSIQLSVKDERI